MVTVYLIYLLYSLKVGLGVYWYEWLICLILLLLTPIWDLAKISYIKNLSDAKADNNKAKDKKTSPFGKIT
jgi:hypothetical protein